MNVVLGDYIASQTGGFWAAVATVPDYPPVDRVVEGVSFDFGNLVGEFTVQRTVVVHAATPAVTVRAGG